MKKNEVKEYHLGSDGKVEAVNNINTQTSKKTNKEYLNNDYSNITISGEYHKSNISVVNQEDYSYDEKLLENPFTYNFSASTANIESIEEFYILKKKKYYLFSGLVRNNDFSLHKRKNMIKDYLKYWKEETERKIDRLNSIGQGQFIETKTKSAEGLKVLDWIISIVCLILAIMLVNGKVWKIRFTEGQDTLKVIAYFAIVATILAMCIAFLISRYIKNNRSLFKKNRREFYRLQSELNKKFKKKYTITYNYYVKGLKKRFRKEKLSIDKTSIEASHIEDIETFISENSKKALQQNKQKSNLVLYRMIAKCLAYASFTYIVITILIVIVKGLFNK